MAFTLALYAPTAAQTPRRLAPSEEITVPRKLALVIGNASYGAGTLRNPHNDARSMEASLKRLGFDVTLALDATRRKMDDLTAAFAGKLRSGDLALFYYSGHGVQLNQENFLIPTDFQGASSSDVRYNAFPAAQVRDRLEDSGARIRVLILDACRDNPYRGTKGGSGGLAPMSSQAEGTLIAYATSDNSTAEDNPAEANGLYTKHLLAALGKGNLTLKQVLEETRTRVFVQSGRKQRPYTYDGIVGDLMLASAITNPGPDPEVAAWQAVEGLNSVPALEAFLKEFPSGRYAGTARVKLAALRAPVARPRSTPDPIVARVGSVDVTTFAGLHYGDKVSRAKQLFGESKSISENVIGFESSTYKGQMAMKIEFRSDGTITKITTDRHELIFLSQHAPTDALTQFLNKPLSDAIAQLGPSLKTETSWKDWPFVIDGRKGELSIGVAEGICTWVMLSWP